MYLPILLLILYANGRAHKALSRDYEKKKKKKMITTAMIDNGIAPTVAKDLIILLYDNTEDSIVPLSSAADRTFRRWPVNRNVYRYFNIAMSCNSDRHNIRYCLYFQSCQTLISRLKKLTYRSALLIIIICHSISIKCVQTNLKHIIRYVLKVILNNQLQEKEGELQSYFNIIPKATLNLRLCIKH
ncbi:hypothetical protein AGLY_001908 [Aphis glycines]|uniref:Mos1 transposase HTH domain-containing protein n=1 Tax=Aphis glycines TaxID=307491 RepID=A0A6G0U578_APHGL|nr:hypothetical protein AGLY_001908 [Aphis glycines]